MRPPRPVRLTIALAGATLVGSLLAGCGQYPDTGAVPQPTASQPTASQPTASQPTATRAVPSQTPGPTARERDPLADAVEDLAKALPLPSDEPSAPTPTGPTYGSDISWPQCPKGTGSVEGREGLGMPMPKPEWKFVVIGLTNGPAMTRNPCLADQVAWAKEGDVLVSAYAVATYPSAEQLATYGPQGPYDDSTKHGKLANWGHAQATYNLTTLRELGLEVPGLWIDVEPVPSPPLVAWSKDKAGNAAVVQGIARAYREADLRVGVYSTPNLWRTVVGDLRLGVPEWRAAGKTSEEEAVRRCRGESIQGGQAVLGQWVEDRRDRNVTCPDQAGQLAHWFSAG